MSAVRRCLLIVALGASVASADVTTTVRGSKLVLDGDDGRDTVLIESAPDGVVVTGHDGTLVDGSSQAVTVAGVRRLVVKLHEGADHLTLSDVELPDGINLRLGRGNDVVVLDDVHTGKARIRTDNGFDSVRIYGPSRLTRLSVDTGNGDDLVVVDGVWVPGDLFIDTGSGHDDVIIVATEVGDDLGVDLGNHDDFLLLADVAVYDDTHLDGDDGDDSLVFSGYIWLEDDLDIDGFGDDWWW